MSKKQIKQLITVVIMLAVCIIGYFCTDHYYQVKTQKAEEESLNAAESEKTVLFELEDVSDITEFSYILDGTTLKFAKNDEEVWGYTDDSSIELDNEVINTTVLNNIQTVKSEEVIEAPEDTAQYGFENPSNVITITYGDNNSKTFIIGAQNEFESSKYYMMLDGDNNVYVIDSSIHSAFSKTIDDLEKEEETTVAETETLEEGETIEEVE